MFQLFREFMRAKVAHSTHRTKHTIGTHLVSGVVALEINEHKGLYYLYRYDAMGRCLADTCHASLAEAMAQAEYEYEIEGPWDKGNEAL